ncbi:MAG: DUF4810 domain-containing protein [Parashewanella sp.]
MKLKQLGLLLAVLTLAGCKSTTMYHWGDYSHTLYDYTKEPSEKTQAKHIKELREIIAKATKKNLKVPPGIYYELGMMEAEQGNKDLALTYLDKELSLFPEAKQFVMLAKKELGAN